MAPIARVPLDVLENSTLAELIDYYAEHHPDSSFTVFPGESADHKPSHVSFLEFGRAAQRFAQAIYPDAPVEHREVVGLLINADSLMYLTAIAGIVRSGSTVSTPPLRHFTEVLMMNRSFPSHLVTHLLPYVTCCGRSPRIGLSSPKHRSDPWSRRL
jgi:hypothetical protein